MQDVVVGLDSGTTSTKAVAAGVDGVVRAVGRSARYRLAVPQPGRAELDPARLQQAAREALDDVARQLEGEHRVVGVCLSSAMHGLVARDADGSPRGPLLTWADARAGEQAQRLRREAPGLHARTLTPLHPMSPLAKLVHLREQGVTAPRWGGVKELLLDVVVPGSGVVDLSTASSSGLYDAAGQRWDPEALERAGVRADQLDRVVPTTQVVGGLAPGLGLPAGTPVVVGATDGPLANLGVGAVAPGVVAVSLGTSGALRVVRPEPGVDPEGRLFCYALTGDRWVVGGAVNNGGSAVRWAGDALGEQDLDVLLAEAAGVPPLADGLLCLPYLLGERAPWWRSGLSGAFLGLRRDHTRAHLVRAVVEGVCQQLALVRDSLPDDVVEVRATGGALASPLWREVLAAALDLPVRVADSPEGSGLGACLLGWHALGGLPDLDAAAALVRVDVPLPPDAAVAARYRRARPLVEQAVAALDGLDLALLDAPDPPRLGA